MDNEIDAEKRSEAEWRAQNAAIPYTKKEMVKIGIQTILFPLYFVPFVRVIISTSEPFIHEEGLSQLRRENFKRKYRQRWLALVLGWTGWLLLFILIVQAVRIIPHTPVPRPVPDVDISEWEQNYIPRNQP